MKLIRLQWSVDNQVQTQSLKAENEIILGRNQECFVCIPHPTVSRQHALLIPRGEEVFLRNLSETNPISMSGGRILAVGEEAILSNNDVFVLGRVNVTYTSTELNAQISFKVKCTGCGKVVETSMTDCPWCGTSLAFGETFIGTS